MLRPTRETTRMGSQFSTPIRKVFNLAMRTPPFPLSLLRPTSSPPASTSVRPGLDRPVFRSPGTSRRLWLSVRPRVLASIFSLASLPVLIPSIPRSPELLRELPDQHFHLRRLLHSGIDLRLLREWLWYRHSEWIGHVAHLSRLQYDGRTTDAVREGEVAAVPELL